MTKRQFYHWLHSAEWFTMGKTIDYMTNLSYRQAMLIKHTAWMNTRLLARGPRPEDERYVPLACGCLRWSAAELRDARP